MGYLGDDDAWVRYAAYRALKKRAPEVDAFADWIWGELPGRAAAAKKWKVWGDRDASKEAVDRALATYPAREKEPAPWARAKESLRALGAPALSRLVEVAADPKRSAAAFAILRNLTGELIPDEIDAWKSHVEDMARKAK